MLTLIQLGSKVASEDRIYIKTVESSQQSILKRLSLRGILNNMQLTPAGSPILNTDASLSSAMRESIFYLIISTFICTNVNVQHIC